MKQIDEMPFYQFKAAVKNHTGEQWWDAARRSEALMSATPTLHMLFMLNYTPIDAANILTNKFPLI